MATYLILQRADRDGYRRVLAHIRQLGLTRRTLRKQLRALDPMCKGWGTSRMRVEELRQTLASLVLNPPWDLLEEVYMLRRHPDLELREGWGWIATAAEVIKAPAKVAE